MGDLYLVCMNHAQTKRAGTNIALILWRNERSTGDSFHVFKAT